MGSQDPKYSTIANCSYSVCPVTFSDPDAIESVIAGFANLRADAAQNALPLPISQQHIRLGGVFAYQHVTALNDPLAVVVVLVNTRGQWQP